MAASDNLPQFPNSYKSAISKSGVLTIYGFGVRVRMQSGHLEIEDGVGEERRTDSARSHWPWIAPIGLYLGRWILHTRRFEMARRSKGIADHARPFGKGIVGHRAYCIHRTLDCDGRKHWPIRVAQHSKLCANLCVQSLMVSNNLCDVSSLIRQHQTLSRSWRNHCLLLKTWRRLHDLRHMLRVLIGRHGTNCRSVFRVRR